MNTHLS